MIIFTLLKAINVVHSVEMVNLTLALDDSFLVSDDILNQGNLLFKYLKLI